MQPFFLIALGVLLPPVGTALGAAAVFFFKKRSVPALGPILYGFAAGVMLAALVWSLLIPALETSPSPFPVAAGVIVGTAFFLLCDWQAQRRSQKSEKDKEEKMFFAVTLHNLPEGMAVGVALASVFLGTGITVESALLLSFGIALQNLPEGAILSLPRALLGQSRMRAFGVGALSGVVEPVGAVAALLLTGAVRALLPFVLAFAAGAMLYVICDELIPSLTGGKGKRAGLMAVGAGFCVMMLMDVILS